MLRWPTSLAYWGARRAAWMPLTLGMALALIQPIKGMIVALQWRVGMHGFEEAKRRREAAAKATFPGGPRWQAAERA